MVDVERTRGRDQPMTVRPRGGATFDAPSGADRSVPLAPRAWWSVPDASRLSSMVAVEPSRSTVLALSIAGVAFGICAEWAFSRTGAPPAALVRDVAVGWAFTGAGLIAWWRQPANRSGPLMLFEGFTWFLSNLQGTGIPLLMAIGVTLGALNEAVLLHLMLAFPGGRLASRWERAVVAAAYGLSVAGGLIFAVADGPDLDPYRCRGCTTDFLLGAGSPGVLRGATGAVEALAAAIGLAALVLIARRWRSTTALGRRILGPVWLSAVVGGLLAFSHGLEVVPAQWQARVVDPFVWASDVGQLAVPLSFLVVVLRMRLARAAVGEVVLQLGQTASLRELRDALMHTLQDPSLELALWLPDARCYVDTDGRPVRLPEPGPQSAVALVEREGRPLAAVIHDPAIAVERKLVEALVAAARLGVESDRLQAELRAQQEVARTSGARLVEAVDAERRRVERDLHDGAQQRLVSLTQTLRAALAQAAGQPDPRLEAALARAVAELQEGLAELRDLARGIYPAILTQRGLAAAVASLADRAPLLVETAVEPGRHPAAIETTAYFVICEALANVARHAGASAATVVVRQVNSRLVVEVADDGVGGAEATGGSGLAGLADRVAALGGSLTLESPAGEGTRVRAELPCG